MCVKVAPNTLLRNILNILHDHEHVSFIPLWKELADMECNADVLGGGANNGNLHELLAEAEALLKQPRRPTDPMIQHALDICNHHQHQAVNLPLKANSDYDMRLLHSYAASGTFALVIETLFAIRLVHSLIGSLLVPGGTESPTLRITSCDVRWQSGGPIAKTWRGAPA